MKLYLSLLLNLILVQNFAQVNYTVLDYNQTSGILANNGILFNNLAQNVSGYEVPKGSGIKAIYATSFWFGATDGSGMLKTACGRYGSGQDFFPGPYSSLNMYSNPSYQGEYFPGFWTVTKAEIDNHIANYSNVGYVMPASIADWPGNGYFALGTSQNLAPFVDLNGDNIYSPQNGDYPLIRGDKATYIIMNDAAGIHTESGGDPLFIEIHVMAYQFASTNFIDTTTFLNLRVFNKSGLNYSNFKTAFYMDADIGNYTDDFVGCDSSKNLIYTYNGDNFDQDNGGALGYGSNPPCLGVVSLNNAMNASGYYTSSSSYPHSDPQTAMEYWNYMNASWANGYEWFYGGMGYTGSPGVTSAPTNFMFSGNPYTGVGWSEVTNNNPPGDRRNFMVLDSVNLNPGQESCFDLAILYSKVGNNLENVQSIIDLADSVQLFFDNQIEFNCEQVIAGLSSQEMNQLSIYPNPGNGEFTIVPDENWAEFSVEIKDMSGRVVYKTEQKTTSKLKIHLTGLTGVFIVTVNSNDQGYSSKLIIE